ncbi:MAG: WD40/YVTN/BNR-like repeat-containing protein, partial [Acidimicrobiales bacterium]
RGEEILVGTEQGHLLRVAGGAPQPVDAFERAPGRERWYTPWGAPPDVRSLAEVDGAVLVNVHVGGIVRSVDLEVWETTVDIDYDVHQVIPVPGRPGWALGAAAVGLLVSTDGGRSWAVETAGLHATYCRAAAATDAWVVVSASAGHRGDRAALYRRPLDGSAPLERCRDGLAEWFASNIDTGCLVAAGSTVAAGTAEGQVFQSDDDGLTWATVASGLPRVRALALL